MPVTTLGEMLDRAGDFEQRLEACYAELRDGTTVDGVGLLTHYLARHRRHLPEALERVPLAQLESIRRTPCKYNGPEFDPEAIFRDLKLTFSTTGRELLDAAIGLVEPLVAFYRWLAEQPLGTEASELFQSLLRIEEAHLVELKKTKAMDYF